MFNFNIWGFIYFSPWLYGSPASRKYNQQFCESTLFDADPLSESAHSFLRIHCRSAVISLQIPTPIVGRCAQLGAFAQ